MSTAQDERTLSGLRLDYEQTTAQIRAFTDIRFKLLAVVPTISGATIALVKPGAAVELLAVGVLGLVATLGVLIYELRNSELCEYAIRRAQRLEAALGLPGGFFADEPTSELRLFGVATIDRDRGLSLVYSASLGGWVYLVAWGVLRALDVGSARTLGAVLGAVVGVIALVALVRVHESVSQSAPTARLQS